MARRPSLRVATFAVVAVCSALVVSLATAPPQPTTFTTNGNGQRAAHDTPLGKITFHPVALTEANKPTPRTVTHPTELALRAATSKVFDVRSLKSTVVRFERPEPGEPTVESGGNSDAQLPDAIDPGQGGQSQNSNPLTPSPSSSFDGLDFHTWGAGHPPDDNGDVGPTYYIQTINSSIGIYTKATGNRVAAFTFNAFMSQGNFGNLCDTDNFGDPVVLYDTYEDRWVITDFAFQLDGSGNVTNPPGAFQCFAVSKTGDPVNGGWNYYSIASPGALNDYPKFGVWPDGIYMSANMFGYAGSSYLGYHVWALNKQQMYDGKPKVQVVDFAGDTSDFTVIPANSRLQTGTPPAGSPEYFVSTQQFFNALSIYKFHLDWDKVSTSTFSGPFTQLQPNCWPNATPASASTTANAADVLAIRAMAQAQYTNMGGAESVWVDHTVQRGVSATNSTCNAPTGGNATVRWYQANVTGGSVAANVAQGATYDPDGANTFFRYMPALAVDRSGDMAVVYSKSNSTTNPQIKYAGRLAADAANTFGQAEATLIDGTGSQSGTCGPSACTRWGDYSGMALDPNGCAFWMTDEYLATNGLNTLTRIGSFSFPGCSTVGNGTLSGTVTDGTNPMAGATVRLGSRTTTTNGSGQYSFSVPAGTYPTESAAKAGFVTSTVSTIAVPSGGTTTRDFALTAAAQSGCFTDNTQTAFQRGVPVNCSITASPGNVVLTNADNTDTKNTSVTSSGFGVTNTAWAGQTFTPTVTGQLRRVDVELFCYQCTATSPSVTLSIRATTGATPVPTGADLATATLAGFNDLGAGGLKTFTFASPITLTAGTHYALIFRNAAAFANGTVAYTCSCTPDTNPYAGGRWVTSANSGSTWTPDAGGRDLNFVTYINAGYVSSGTLLSSLKDANPAPGSTPNWTTLSFSATTPAGTGVKFQIAASNSNSGPFNYVGPDGTAATFFTTSGASLSQFNGFQYLKYKAILRTTDGSVTPSLSSVQVCFNDVVGSAAATSLAVGAASGTYGGSVNLSATLTSSGSPVSGKSVSFTLNGTSVGSASTNASGIATLNGASLAGINVGSYPTGVGASFAGDSSYAASSGSAALTVAKAATTTSVVSSANPAVASQSVTFTATVSSAAGTPAGTVQFKVDGTNLGSPVTLDGLGKAVSPATSSLTVASHSITAVYGGNANFTTSTGSMSQSVTKANANVSVTSNHNPAAKGSQITFTVTVTPTSPATATPKGKVKLLINGTQTSTTHKLNGGKSSWTFTWTKPKGTFNVTVQYLGNAKYAAATSPIYSQLIN